MEQKIQHVALIPDGNRRWARARGLKPWIGHQYGIESFRNILKEALALGIPHLTVWGASRDNVEKRPFAEMRFYFKLLRTHFLELLQNKTLHKEQVRVSILGKWEELFPAPLKAVFKNVIEKTGAYNRLHLTFLMGYDGREEMLEAMNRIKANGETVSAAAVKRNLWTHELPPVDLVIRTGGEPHWSSGFMMWDVADAQLYFTETLWPAFTPAEFRKAVAWTAGIERRLGK